MTDLAPRPRRWPAQIPSVVVHLVYDEDRYQSAECQLGAHHACPGGVRKGTEGAAGIVRLLCQCSAVACTCCQRR